MAEKENAKYPQHLFPMRVQVIGHQLRIVHKNPLPRHVFAGVEHLLALLPNSWTKDDAMRELEEIVNKSKRREDDDDGKE